MTYYTIVFFQNSAYTDLFEGCFDEYDVANNRNVAELAFRYLQQWDYGSESEHSPLDKEPWGSSDKTHDFQDGDWTYTLSINPSLDYISLTRWKAAQ
tara:strand:- start:583 stop:873 length:291 start_codon:yes stop_codon:yes gene_type:complete